MSASWQISTRTRTSPLWEQRICAQGRHARQCRGQIHDELPAYRPNSVGNETRVLVSELSGKDNIAVKRQEFGLDGLEPGRRA